jgi:xanthine dehydrogenase small subunit
MVRGAALFAPVAEYFRQHLGLTGTKIVCAEGDCGACSVLVGRVGSNGLTYQTLDSCIAFVYQLDATHIVTVEGLGTPERLHPIQQALVEQHGSQCGYCTPGFALALAGYVEAGAPAELAAQQRALTGNLCRCTGYTALLAATEQVRQMAPARWADHPQATAWAQQLTDWQSEPLHLSAAGRQYWAPTHWDDLPALLPATLVAGHTELGVWHNKRQHTPPRVVSLQRLPEAPLTVADGRVSLGVRTTWTDLELALLPHLPAFTPIVRRFGSPQIRNAATLVGNLANGSPIADGLPTLLALDAQVELHGPTPRTLPLRDYYTGYKQSVLQPNEVIRRVGWRLPASDERMRCYKVSRRQDMDISTVGATFVVRVDAHHHIRSAALAYNGVGPTAVRLPAAEAALVGQPFAADTFRAAGAVAANAVQPISDVRGGADYRLRLVANLLHKFYYDEMANSPHEL